jgi:hypothetical protein
MFKLDLNLNWNHSNGNWKKKLLLQWAWSTVPVRPAWLGVPSPLGLSAQGRGAGELAPMASAYVGLAKSDRLAVRCLGGGSPRARQWGLEPIWVWWRGGGSPEQWFPRRCDSVKGDNRWARGRRVTDCSGLVGESPWTSTELVEAAVWPEDDEQW